MYGKRRVRINCFKCEPLVQAVLEALNEIVHLFIREVAHMANAKCCALDLSQAFSNLNSIIAFKPSPQRCNVKTLWGDNAGNSISRLERVNFHSRTPDQITNRVGNLQAALKHP